MRIGFLDLARGEAVLAFRLKGDAPSPGVAVLACRPSALTGPAQTPAIPVGVCSAPAR